MLRGILGQVENDVLEDILIVGCSRAKKALSGPAIEVYDGPLFRTIRRRIPEIGLHIGVFIISAKHGILSHDERIEPYDETIVTAISPEFSSKISFQLMKVLPPKMNKVLLIAPQNYLEVVPVKEIETRSKELRVFSGRSGKCQAVLLEWLGIEYIRDDKSRTSLGPLSSFSSPFEPRQISEVVNRVIQKSESENCSIQWYARVDGRKIPAKKLVATLTGVPVSSFETSHALALLHRNGIETCRVTVT